MHTLRTMLALLVALPPPLAGAEVYKCTDDNGFAYFAEKPCGDDATKIEVQTYTITPDYEQPPPGINPSAEELHKVDNRLKIKKIDEQIDGIEREVKKLTREKNGHIAEIDAMIKRANENQAGSANEKDFAWRKAAITTMYNKKINEKNAHINTLLSLKEALTEPPEPQVPWGSRKLYRGSEPWEGID